MLEEEQVVKEFLQSQGKIEKYNEAIRLLREIGFDVLLRRLGEPRHFDYAEPNLVQSLAFDHAELRGWYNCIEAVFKFPLVVDDTFLDDEQDFGADEMLRN